MQVGVSQAVLTLVTALAHYVADPWLKRRLDRDRATLGPS